jgi:hypothetical protein
VVERAPIMPPKAKKKKGGEVAPKTTVEVDPGELQQSQYVRQSLQSHVSSLKERVKSLGDDNEHLRKSRVKVRAGVAAAV